MALPEECKMSLGLDRITSMTGLVHICATAQEHGQPDRNVTITITTEPSSYSLTPQLCLPLFRIAEATVVIS